MVVSSSNPGLVCCIFAGGKATRLYPHTLCSQNQKPMLVMGHSSQRLIDYSLRVSSHADHTYVITNHSSEKAEIIECYALKRSNAIIMRDKRLSGTGSSIIDHYHTFSEEDSNSNIVILAADHVHEGFDLGSFYRYHLEKESEVTLLTSPAKDYGDYVIMDNGLAKAVPKFTPSSLSTTGTYIIKLKYILDWIHLELSLGWDGEPLNFYQRVICPAIENNRASVFSLPYGAYWDDAGTPYRYYQNNMRISEGQNVISELATVSPLANIVRSVVVGDAIIRDNQLIVNAIVSNIGDRNYVEQVCNP